MGKDRGVRCGCRVNRIRKVCSTTGVSCASCSLRPIYSVSPLASLSLLPGPTPSRVFTRCSTAIAVLLVSLFATPRRRAPHVLQEKASARFVKDERREKPVHSPRKTNAPDPRHRTHPPIAPFHHHLFCPIPSARSLGDKARNTLIVSAHKVPHPFFVRFQRFRMGTLVGPTDLETFVSNPTGNI